MIDKITWTIVNNVNDLGTAVRIKVNFFEDDAAADPDDAEIKVFDPHGVTAQTLSSMTRVTAGIYEYNFQTDASDAPGKYRASVSFTSDSMDLVEDDITFYVE
jgi:uncharacterized protein YfaS (alpha-2-macroglobulin family)